ncbi:hypothetical protein QCA50_007637 [Cerrena zonata]|uniref:Uncharacterized protein n=1 Tax=Cerrena zonata TaxID=2478898 RepID=A0AAW0G8A4_9APHY
MPSNHGPTQSPIPQREPNNIYPESPSSGPDLSSVIDSLFDVAKDASDTEGDDSILHGEYTGDSEDEDFKGYVNLCTDCDDCRAKHRARDERIGRVLVLAHPDDECITTRYCDTEGDPSYITKWDQPHHATPIGQRPYKSWPLPDGEGHPIRSLSHGQQTTTHNVVQSMTYPTHRVVDDYDAVIYFENTLQNIWVGFYQARDAPRLRTIQSLPAQQGRQ